MNVPITAYPNGGSQPPLAGDLLIYRHEHDAAPHALPHIAYEMPHRHALPPPSSGLHLVSA